MRLAAVDMHNIDKMVSNATITCNYRVTITDSTIFLLTAFFYSSSYDTHITPDIPRTEVQYIYDVNAPSVGGVCHGGVTTLDGLYQGMISLDGTTMSFSSAEGNTDSTVLDWRD